MTSREQLEKASRDLMLGTQDYVRQKLVQARQQGLLKDVPEEQYKMLLSMVVGAVEAGHKRCSSSFVRSLEPFLK